MKKSFFTTVLLVVLCALVLSSCGAETVLNMPKRYNLPEQLSSVNSGEIAENENILLSWDYESSTVIIKDKINNTVWSTTPYDFYSSDSKASAYVENGICSSLRVTYLDAETNTENEVNSKADASYVTAQKSETAIRLTYYFDKINISVPVTYTINEDGITVTLETKLITEGENSIISVAVAPFLASAKNNTDSYLFVPSGGGALMYTDDNKRDSRLYSEPIYGLDATAQEIYQDTTTEEIKMPVFGVKSENGAIFGIITAGAESAEISAIAGDSQYGFSAVYPEFNLRGKASSLVEGSANTNNNILKYSEDIVNQSKMVIRYYLLGKDKGDYNGFAEVYRNYLEASAGLKSGVSNPDAMFTFLGGVEQRKLFLGVPYHTLSSVTTFSQAKEILADIDQKSNPTLAVNLKGFGSSGLDYGKIGGGFKADKVFGGKKGLKALNDWTKLKNIDLFYDFNMVFYNQSYGDFGIKDAAMTANDVLARFCSYNIVTRQQNKEGYAYVAKRLTLAKSAKTIIENANILEINGIGLSTLTKTAYSDYNSPDYYCKAHMSDDVINLLGSIKNKDYKILGESANAYAAPKLDYIYDISVNSSKYYALDMDIPFYHMVFRGAVALSGEPVNLSSEPRVAFLDSVLTGSSLAFSLCNNYNDGIFNSRHSAVALSVYEGIAEEISGYIKEIQPLLSKIGSAKIISFEREDDIAYTVFENGITVCVNYGKTVAKTDFGKIEPKSFIYK